MLGLYERFGLDPEEKHDQEWALSPTLMRRQAEVLHRGARARLRLRPRRPRVGRARCARGRHEGVGLCGSPRNAERQRAAGVDVIVAQGYEAGGHTGYIATLALVPQVVDAVAPSRSWRRAGSPTGGRSPPRSRSARRASGAARPSCSPTRSTFSGAARPARSQARRSDVVAGRSYTGKPSRVVQNEVTKPGSSRARPAADAAPDRADGRLHDAAEVAGKYELINNPAGQAAGRLTAREPARMIVRRLAADAARVIEELGAQVTPSA